ncbi:MAG: VWA domain-containing protein [Acidobacteriota bacterium]|nr:VWA domain-containing protein [Acidobacteriota bacterium]
MSGKRLYLSFLFSLCIIGSSPHTPMPAAAAQDEGAFRVRVDVDMVTIEVTALDKKDNPVPNLKREDFELYEDGKKQDIVSLDEIVAGPGSSALGASPIAGPTMRRGKTVFILFDDSAISPQYIKTSRDTAERFVREHMRPQDLFAVAQYDMSMKILQNFTSEKEEVLAAIRRPAAASMGSALYFENLLRALDKIFQAIAPIRGQKSILIYSQSGFGPSYTTPTLANTYAATLMAAKKANVVIYTLSPEDLGSSGGSMGGMPATMPGGGRGLGAISSLGAAVTLRSLATESGGFSIYNTNNYDGELDKFDQRLSNYYILGFQSSNPKHDGGFRKIEIKTRAKGVILKYRPGYQDRRPVDVLASSRQEKTLLTALATPSTAIQLPITFRPAFFYDSLQSARVLIAARLQMEKAALKKKGGQLETDLNIMGVAYAEDGSVAARFSETIPISFAKEQEAEFRKSALPYRNYFKLRPGKYRLKLAASDEENNLGAAEQSLEIPVPNTQGFSASSLVVAEQLSQLPDLIRNLQTQLLDQSDPLLLSQMQIEPSIANRLPAKNPVAVLFRIYNLAGPLNQLNLLAKTRLFDATGERFALAPIQLKEIVSPAGPSEVVVGMRLPLQSVPAGKYRLAMEISETGTGQSATIQTDLELY